MPAAKNNGQIRAQAPDELACSDRIADHRPGQQRNTEGDALLQFLLDCGEVVRRDRAVEDAWLVTRFAQRRGQAQKPQRRPENAASVRREKQQHTAIARDGQHVTASAESWCASTLAFRGGNQRLAASFSQSSNGRAYTS